LVAVKANRVATKVRCETALVGWETPPDGWVKLNKDGSCKV